MNPQASQMSQISNIGSSSGGSSASQKYDGLIHRSPIKLLREKLFNLNSYVYQVTPPFTMLHRVMSFFRYLQIIGPALAVNFRSLWIPGELQTITMSYLSILWNILPYGYTGTTELYFMVVFLTLFAIFVIVVAPSMQVLHRTAKLPTWIPYFLVIGITTLIQIGIPVLLYHTGSIISTNIWDNRDHLVFSIVIVVLTAAIVSGSIYVLLRISFQVITFQQFAILGVMPSTHCGTHTFTYIISFCAGVGTFAPHSVQTVLLIINFFSYALEACLPFYRGGFVSPRDNSTVLSTCASSAIAQVVVIIVMWLGGTGSFIYLLIYFVCVAIFLWAGTFLINYIDNKLLVTLDKYSEDPDTFQFIKSANDFIVIAVAGLRYAHPSIINWSFFLSAVDRWPQDQHVWLLFAKSVAIYPSETQRLGWIRMKIYQNQAHGSATQIIKQDGVQLMRTRESNLSPQLKGKLNSLNKSVASAKHKLRHVWDIALQGNLGELESATHRAIDSIQQCDADFKRLYRQYPNNRFVTRAYSHFLVEVAGNEQEAQSFAEKTALLVRGAQVKADDANVYGLIAFPNLPSSLGNSGSFQNAADSAFLSAELSEDERREISEDGTNSQQAFEKRIMLRQKIMDLSIPAIKKTRITRYILFIVLIAFSVIFLCIYQLMHKKEAIHPLPYIHDMSLARNYLYMLTAFVIKYTQTVKGAFAPFNEPDTPPPYFIGNTWDTKSQIVYIVAQLNEVNQNLGSISSLSGSSEALQNAKSYICDKNINYRYYTSKDQYTTQQIDVVTAISNYIQILGDFSSKSEAELDLNAPYVLNLAWNSDYITGQLNKGMDALCDMITTEQLQSSYGMRYVNIIFLVLNIVAFIGSTVIEIMFILKNKREAYRCLTSLPKSTVSLLAENLRIIKKETTTISSQSSYNSNSGMEFTKQEENLIKTLSIGSSTSFQFTDILIPVLTIIYTALSIISIYLMTSNIITTDTTVVQNAPHINQVLGAITNMFVQQFSTSGAFTAFQDQRLVLWSPEGFWLYYSLCYGRSKVAYKLARYGDETGDTKPFIGFNNLLNVADSLTNCEDPYAKSKDFIKVTECYDSDTIFSVITSTIETRMNVFTTMGDVPNNKDKLLSDVWQLTLMLFNNLFFPMFSAIIDIVNLTVDATTEYTIIITIVLLIVSCMLEIVVQVCISRIDRHIHNVLLLLVMLPPDVVFANQKVMAVLSGDFSEEKGDSSKHTNEFYEKVREELPDAIVTIDNDTGIIQTANKSCTRIFGIEASEIVGSRMGEYFTNETFVATSEMTMRNLIKDINALGQSGTFIYRRKTDDTELFLEISAMLINQSTVVITARDVSQAIHYNQLIEEERRRSDGLLTSILPQSLVKRVQDGEKTISIEVQSATISFMDIVSFTPWCGSNTSAFVMSTLNNMYRRYDAALACYPTMTKIKCIGDCYMCAGGIFMEINQPTEHAKEVVSFGLDALDCLQELNKELGTSLQIRVGVNTGGPIVAGVLGIGKPTFEILGPAINMAQQMEHNGIPSQVHVSRAVYELIYGGQFSIKERGTIEVKGGQVVTYLVSRSGGNAQSS